MQPRIPRSVVHYSSQDPRTHRGGVESFARNLALVFERVEFMTPRTRDEAKVRRERLPVICDNQLVLDWPEDMTVIGFQHGVAADKVRTTRSLGDLLLAARQARAARRPNVIWVACAQWIAQKFARRTRCPSGRVIYHSVDLTRFDGVLHASGSRLVLHDARSPHKGKHLIPELARRLPAYRFEALDCPPDRVPERMRGALAFLHLSRYEGNSIVCNEAMAMNLPCLFTRVGLMLDEAEGLDVETVEAKQAFTDDDALARRVSAFLEDAERRQFRPRQWIERNASHEASLAGWGEVLETYDRKPAERS